VIKVQDYSRPKKKVQDYWIIDIVIKIIQKPLEIEKTCLHSKELLLINPYK